MEEIRKITDKDLKEQITKIVLDDLIEWFGIEESKKEYILQSRECDYYAYYIDNIPVGFLYIFETSKYTVELACMGILKSYHHKGIGKRLISYLSSDIKDKYKFLQVKTVEYGHYKEYDITNKFYQAMGFYELEVFKTLWDPHNPCQIYIKSLQNEN